MRSTGASTSRWPSPAGSASTPRASAARRVRRRPVSTWCSRCRPDAELGPARSLKVAPGMAEHIGYRRGSRWADGRRETRQCRASGLRRRRVASGRVLPRCGRSGAAGYNGRAARQCDHRSAVEGQRAVRRRRPGNERPGPDARRGWASGVLQGDRLLRARHPFAAPLRRRSRHRARPRAAAPPAHGHGQAAGQHPGVTRDRDSVPRRPARPAVPHALPEAARPVAQRPATGG